MTTQASDPDPVTVRVDCRRRRLIWPGGAVPCAIGTGGATQRKAEGDGATPLGRFPMRKLYYRADRLAPPQTGLPVRQLTPDDGWCDDSGDASYNRFVTLPYPARHERLWRADHLYDIIVELGYNDDPPRPDLGSAIFLHLARDDYAPTEGCIALALEDMQALLPSCRAGTILQVEAGS
jgi:L,D-peptidoglycan transpeptidase YkuD (ErfK/YbiS/YcfS/YnhG family)